MSAKKNDPETERLVVEPKLTEAFVVFAEVIGQRIAEKWQAQLAEEGALVKENQQQEDR